MYEGGAFMKQYPLLNNKTSRFAFALFLTAMLFLSRDTLFSSCLMGFAQSQILMFGLIVFLGAAFLWVNRKEFLLILKDRRIPMLAFAVLIIVLPMVIKRDWQLMYFSILLCVLTAIFLTYFTSSREVAKYYVVILVILGIYSVVASYGLKYLARAEMINPGKFLNSSRLTFYNFWFTYVPPSYHWYRNYGIFREPGVYQFFALLAIYLNNYNVDWDRAWKLWSCNAVLVVTLLSTFAIGGYAELALLTVFLFFDKKWYRSKSGRIAAAVVVTFAVSLISAFFYFFHHPSFAKTIFYEFYDMFLRLFTGSDSMRDRVDAILVNLQFFVRNPLVGDAIAEVLHGTNHNTSSTLLLYAIFGVVGGTLNVAAWIALLWKRNRNLLGNLILLVIMFMSFNTQNLVANVFFWLFPMMVLVERGMPLLKKE